MATKPNPNRKTLGDQLRLSEQLQLLRHFGYSDSNVGQYSNKDQRHHAINLHILNTIAVALTTGRPGEVFAAAFYRRKKLTLVLAKNDDVTNEDRSAVRDLFKVLTAPETTEAQHVLPFLFSRCGENIVKRIRKLDETVHEFLRDLDNVLENYKPAPSIEEEFPNSTDYRYLKYDSDEEISFVEMIYGLLATITRVVDAFNLDNLSATPNLNCRYVLLAFTALVLEESRLLRSLCNAASPMHLERKRQAERLKRRLAKVCQYNYGIGSLIRRAKRLFPQGVDHRWVDPIRDAGENTFHLDDDCLNVLKRKLSNIPLLQDTQSTLCRKFPDMEMRRKSRSVMTRLHPEIQILLHLRNPVDTLDHSQQQPIGCSKGSCLCCALWIQAYNEEFGTGWGTSGSNGKPCAAWALPGCSDVDDAVLERVQERLSQTLAKVFPNLRRISDELRPSVREGTGLEPDECALLWPRAGNGVLPS